MIIFMKSHIIHLLVICREKLKLFNSELCSKAKFQKFSITRNFLKTKVRDEEVLKNWREEGEKGRCELTWFCPVREPTVCKHLIPDN